MIKSRPQLMMLTVRYQYNSLNIDGNNSQIENDGVAEIVHCNGNWALKFLISISGTPFNITYDIRRNAVLEDPNYGRVIGIDFRVLKIEERKFVFLGAVLVFTREGNQIKVDFYCYWKGVLYPGIEFISLP